MPEPHGSEAELQDVRVVSAQPCGQRATEQRNAEELERLIMRLTLV